MSERAIAELPTGPYENGGGVLRPPHLPIAELPQVTEVFQPEAIQELFRLRDRVHALESQALAARLRFPVNPVVHELPKVSEFYRPPVGVGAPNEIPITDIWQTLQGILSRLGALEVALTSKAG
jgi:hypothetical protein